MHTCIILLGTCYLLLAQVMDNSDYLDLDRQKEFTYCFLACWDLNLKPRDFASTSLTTMPHPQSYIVMLAKQQMKMLMSEAEFSGGAWNLYKEFRENNRM